MALSHYNLRVKNYTVLASITWLIKWQIGFLSCDNFSWQGLSGLRSSDAELSPVSKRAAVDEQCLPR